MKECHVHGKVGKSEALYLPMAQSKLFQLLISNLLVSGLPNIIFLCMKWRVFIFHFRLGCELVLLLLFCSYKDQNIQALYSFSPDAIVSSELLMLTSFPFSSLGTFLSLKDPTDCFLHYVIYCFNEDLLNTYGMPAYVYMFLIVLFQIPMPLQAPCLHNIHIAMSLCTVHIMLVQNVYASIWQTYQYMVSINPHSCVSISLNSTGCGKLLLSVDKTISILGSE